MHAGRTACCSLVSHVEYANRTDRRTDRRQTVTLCFPLDMASIITVSVETCYATRTSGDQCNMTYYRRDVFSATNHQLKISAV